MGRDLKVGLKLTARRDSSLQTNLNQTAKGLEKIGSEARRSGGLTKSAANTQTRALGNTERKTGLLTRAYQRSSRTMRTWSKSIRKSTGDLKKQRQAVDLMNKGLDGVSNRYTGLVGTVGAGMTIRNVGNAQERLERLGIQAGLSSEKMKQLKKDIYATALQEDIRVDPKEILAGIESIVEKTGNLAFAEKNMRNIGLAIQATGANGTNIGEIFGEFEKTGIRGPEKVIEALDILNVQGKAGAFTLQNLASLGPRVITAYTATGRSGTTALREMGAALQIIRMGTGSSEQAATAFEAVIRSLTDPVKIKKLEKMGLELFDPEKLAEGKRVLRPINELIKEIIQTADADTVVLGEVFDSEAMKSFNHGMGEFQRTGGLETIDKLYKVQANGQGVMDDSARAARTFNASLTMIAASWEKFADLRLTGPIESVTKLLDTLGSEGANRLFTGLTVAGGGLLGALAIRKGVGLYQGVKGLFGGKRKRGGGRSGNLGLGMGMDVQNVRIVNWPASRGLRSLEDGDSNGRRKRRGKKRGKSGRLSRVSKRGRLSRLFKGGGLSRLFKGGGFLRKSSRLLGRVGGPIAAVAGLVDLGSAIKTGDSRKIGGSLGRSGGGLAGAAAGAAIGSVVPVVGTIIGGIAGGILGSLFGEKIGEAAGTAMKSKPSPPAPAQALAKVPPPAQVPALADGPLAINIYPSPGQSPKSIADEAMRLIEKRRGRRLHD
ncbi:MAG: phage tail tape measure protein [Desulfobacteraceae bacterium]|nr:phage tail tape measure protein [Desulfobacteraceae bacterium]